ncbi:hypothetical protein [Caballeronia sp. INDeC2]|uniref:hypothetical protein n=1 Tax=Caballeronia sp. INDeC2 TaxID=2921747 RepID=UPI00202772C7|nr:hypothetical protein [Caballeronia sp. INDeC2]
MKMTFGSSFIEPGCEGEAGECLGADMGGFSVEAGRTGMMTGEYDEQKRTMRRQTRALSAIAVSGSPLL